MRTVVAIALITMLALPACGAIEPMVPPPGPMINVCKGIPAPPPDIRDDPACKLFRWPLSVEQAKLILKQTETFADTAIYMLGPPPQMAAFNVLFDQPDSVAAFDEVARTGGRVGRLYALCAFQVLDLSRASHLATELRADGADVFTQFGCVGSHQPVPDVVNHIERYSTGREFRGARDRTYAYLSRPANICLQATAGGTPSNKTGQKSAPAAPDAGR